jgi:sarcosine oxidase subunit alpha
MTDQPNRLSAGGRIDRSSQISIRFDGRQLHAHRGDTLASALLANGISLVARSFKYHRPRGIYSAGVEEPNALVGLRTDARTEPNTRATIIEAYDGLEANSQNRFPSLTYDLGAVNNLASRFLPAGFYYKTFIGPGQGTKAWMLYERFIRKAAGMGRAVKQLDPDAYEKINRYCDVLVIGSGPAGLCAALAAGRTGARVTLAEQDFEIGGSLLDEKANSEHATWLGSIVDELLSMKNVRVMPRTTVFGAYDSGVFGLVERVWDHVTQPPPYQPRQRYYLMRTKAAVLASGAIEQPLVFGGNDLPGVMLASAVRSYLHRYAVLPGRKVVVTANNDSAFTVAHDLAAAGASVTYVDSRRDIFSSMNKLLNAVGVETITGHAVFRTKGKKRVKAVDIVPVDVSSGRATGETRTVEADLLAVSGGWSPSLHLWSQLGGNPRFNADHGAYFPEAARTPQIVCAGMVSPDPYGDIRSKQWIEAGTRAARKAGFGTQNAVVPALPATPFSGLARVGRLTSWVATDKDGNPGDKAFLDLQHDVTVTDIDLGNREGLRSVEHIKRYTTAGMATDQGKTSNLNVLARMAVLQGVEVGEVGTTRFRPPFTPVSFGALIGQSRGTHVAPTRLSAIHDWHVANGAVFIPAGAWQRPWYYPSAQETLGNAYIREADHVRNHVGLVDVSTLGKIAIQGPDAAELLDRVYVNGFKALKIGRIRYGVMLREDGLVLDDGTTARLGETEYLMSTTTANAAKVLSHLEFLHQTAWPTLKVTLTSVTDQWAAIAVAGPRSRELLQNAAASADLSPEALPNMALTDAEIDGMAARIHRMSFSGELAYEVYVGSGFGLAIWEALIRVGEPLGVLPYGTEAMGTLRIEKGHVSAPELDGRTAIGDLGMERMASKRKPFVGSVLRQRSALLESDRPSLVGLEALSTDTALKPGMLLFPEIGEIEGHGDGYVSSVTWSPADRFGVAGTRPRADRHDRPLRRSAVGHHRTRARGLASFL